jgi:hypothetical protein
MEDWQMNTSASLKAENDQLRADVITLALRLYGEDATTFAPETAEVMHRWEPQCMALLTGRNTNEPDGHE